MDSISTKLKRHYDSRASENRNATSPDYNLREVEISTISKHLSNGQKILDLGCGNGYSTLMYASKFNSEFLGIDYSKPMIDAEKNLTVKFNLLGKINFEVRDVINHKLPNSYYDYVITQRLLINLPSEDIQKKMINNIYKSLKLGGKYLMCEGTIQGHQRLNELRLQAGLEEIPSTSSSNFWSLKLDELKIHEYIKNKFIIESIHPFGTYFLVSRIIHPLLVTPKIPKYNAKINSIAAELQTTLKCNPLDIGHQRLYVLRKI